MEELKLTKAERFIISNQFAILEFLSRAIPDIATRDHCIHHDPNYYSWAQNVIQAGDSVLVDQIGGPFREEELSREAQEEILSTLDMYRHIQWSYDSLEDKQGLSEKDVAFPGWDGHRNELGFARRFCYRNEEGQGYDGKPDRYDMIKPSPAFDSHWPTIYRYRAMFQAYEPIRKAALGVGWRPMTADELKTVLNVTVE
jgi:hypothetical protein